jgi:Flp pilus assembly protein TadD
MYAAALAVLAITAPAVTFNKDVAPIVYRYCAPCHRPGEAAPFPLLTYAEARSRAADIAAVVGRRFMPPWLPSPGPGFEGELRLSDEQIAVIRNWAAQGAPEGDRRDLPPAPKYPDGWYAGPPDLVLKLDPSYTLPAEGPDVFRNFVLPVSIGGPRYVKAVEIRPGNKRLVHHANLLVDRRRESRRLDEADPEPGFGGMDISLESDVFDPDSHFLFWKPGTPPRVDPPELAWRLDPGTDLVLNLHLQPSGKPESVEVEVGLYFSNASPSRFPMLLQLEHDGALDIPPGRSDFVVTDSFTLPVDADLLSVYPHAHYLGKRLTAAAVLPGGGKRTLIEIRDWDMAWQGVYHYRRPVFLPKGSVVSMRWIYDNSAANVRNPSHPPRRVTAGNRATDEMAHLWLQVLPRGAEDRRLALQQALMEARLRKYPGDFTAHFNLGSVLLSRNKAAEAARHFRAALKTSAASPAARTALGAALQAMGRAAEAIAEYRRAIAADAGYSDARYNLANLLAEQDELAGAAAEYRRLVAIRPSDQEAIRRLATVLLAEGDRFASASRWPDAIRLYREAIELRPDDPDAHNNLGGALAASGNTVEARKHFETALQLNPEHQMARRNLELLRANRP